MSSIFVDLSTISRVSCGVRETETKNCRRTRQFICLIMFYRLGRGAPGRRGLPECGAGRLCAGLRRDEALRFLTGRFCTGADAGLGGGIAACVAGVIT